MSTHSKRLRSGVRELVRTENTTLEDLHIVATDVIASLDKLASKIVRKLKRGQAIRIYDEDSNKEYGQTGSDIRCYFSEVYDTKVRGTTLKVYDEKKADVYELDIRPWYLRLYHRIRNIKPEFFYALETDLTN